MKNTTKTIIVFALLFVSFSAQAVGGDLCMNGEIALFSFSTKSNKLMSICMKSNREYMVYRYGRQNNIEMQFPDRLDADSWRSFTFSGMKRSGGKANAGYGDYDLSFARGQITYVVYQKWDSLGDTYSIGISVRNDKHHRTIDIKGMPSTQQGSLVLLEAENTHIENTAQ